MSGLRGGAYSPMYFLASLGAGGLAVSFFIYLMFMVDHPDTPMVTFDHLWPLLADGPLAVRALVGVAMCAILVLALVHFRLLLWNLGMYARFRRTEVYRELRNSNHEVTLMVIPLTLAMSINLAFVLGAVFVPGLWTVVEYLFPLAILGFLAVGIYALRVFTDYLTRLFIRGDFDFVDNNNLSQMIAIFAFAMVAVGLAAPGAMSHHVEINAIAIFLSIFFASVAVLLGGVKFVLGFKSIIRHGLNEPASPSVWLVIPILTLLGITFVRLSFGLVHGFDGDMSRHHLFVMGSVVVSLEMLFGLLGMAVMRRMGYFRDYLHGEKRDPGSYSLICPGVAFFVFGMFFIYYGLGRLELVERFSPLYFGFLLPLVYVQIKTLFTFLRLNRRFFGGTGLRPGRAAIGAI
jgi:uncharacterized membrane protein YidH (DUF202 family)